MPPPQKKIKWPVNFQEIRGHLKNNKSSRISPFKLINVHGYILVKVSDSTGPYHILLLHLCLVQGTATTFLSLHESLCYFRWCAFHFVRSWEWYDAFEGSAFFKVIREKKKINDPKKFTPDGHKSQKDAYETQTMKEGISNPWGQREPEPRVHNPFFWAEPRRRLASLRAVGADRPPRLLSSLLSSPLHLVPGRTENDASLVHRRMRAAERRVREIPHPKKPLATARVPQSKRASRFCWWPHDDSCGRFSPRRERLRDRRVLPAAFFFRRAASFLRKCWAFPFSFRLLVLHSASLVSAQCWSERACIGHYMCAWSTA